MQASTLLRGEGAMACSVLPIRVFCAQRNGGGFASLRTPPKRLSVRAASDPEDCNQEDFAPEKEVGRVSMEWKASDSTQVVGTYPPLSKKKWTGYVEKDTAGQTNIYAVEPTVYVSENAISSNTAGDSTKGSQQTLIVAVGLAIGLLVGAGVVLLSVNVSPTSPSPSPDTANLSYYIQKFSPGDLSIRGSVLAGGSELTGGSEGQAPPSENSAV